MPNIKAKRKQDNNKKNTLEGLKNKTELVAYVTLCTNERNWYQIFIRIIIRKLGKMRLT